jgi:hypothetical protein
MKTCDKLPLYLYNEMNNKEIANFQKHMLNCRKCRQSAQIINKIRDIKVLHSAPPHVIEALFAKTSRKNSFWNLHKTLKAGTIAAAAGLFIAIFTITEHSGLSLSYYSKAYNVSPVSYEEMANIGSNIDELESATGLNSAWRT